MMPGRLNRPATGWRSDQPGTLHRRAKRERHFVDLLKTPCAFVVGIEVCHLSGTQRKRMSCSPSVAEFATERARITLPTERQTT